MQKRLSIPPTKLLFPNNASSILVSSFIKKVGAIPVKELLVKSIAVNCVKDPISDGKIPEKELNDIVMDSNDAFNEPISEGKTPVNELKSRANRDNSENDDPIILPISEGSNPEKRFKDKVRVCREVVFPISVGIVPGKELEDSRR